jgi:hypothetical protein
MNLIQRVLFVIGGIMLGGYVLNLLINPGDALPRNNRMGEWREAKVRPACYEALESLKDPQLPKLPSTAKHVDFGTFARTVEMTAALHCYVVTQRDAICEPNNRAWIVDYVGKYYGKLDTLLSAAARHGEPEAQSVRQAFNGERSRAIAAALEGNIREGRLTKADFGWSVPTQLKPLFEKYAGARDTCPQRTASAQSR